MQFLPASDKLGNRIKCPVCDSLLETVKEQDHRVHIMHHPLTAACPWSDKAFRVDRLTGYAETWPSVSEEEAKVLCQPTEDATRISTTISAQSPPTATTKTTRLIPQATPAGGHGRTRRFPGRG